MKRFWVQMVTGLAAIGGTVVLASACAHNDSSFFLRSVLAPPQSASSSGCLFTADPTQPEEPSGVLDVGVTSAYYAEFLAGNQITPQANQQQIMTETSRIIVQGAVVKILEEDTQAELADYTTYGTGSIDPANGTTPGYGPVGFMVVDPTTAATLLTKLEGLGHPFGYVNILTYVTAFGTTLGGDHVESNTFEFQITACNGCLIQYTTSTPFPSCSGPAPTSSGASLCYVGQDVPFDCHRCEGNPLCDCGQNVGPCPAM